MQQFFDMENQDHNTMGDSPWEAELQELMEQIDIMVSNKKLDWERKMRALETRLDIRDQELADAQTSLDQKGQEVGLLKQKLDSLEKCNIAMTQNYEGQLQTLKAQFCKLTNSFEKLRLHQMKQNKFRRKESSHFKEEIPFKLSNLNQKLEEFRAKSREWDKQEILYQTHLVSLDAQQKLLSEKYNQFQKQAQIYQTQLSGKKQCIEEDSSSEIPQLMCEPEPSCETSDKDEFIIEKLKSAVSEMAISRNKLQDENQKLLQELKMYQRQCQAMEAGLSEVKSELQSRDDLLRIIEMERLQLHRELLKIRECQNAQENKKRLEPSYSPIKELERQSTELFSVTPDQPNHVKEYNKVKSHLHQEGEQHGSEQERMRNEISALTEELRQKEMAIATIMKKAALLERQLKMELEIKEKMLARQQVSDMRYKAFRTENTHLKGMMGDLDPRQYLTSGITDIKSTDCTNRERSRYTTINKLEYENERLRDDLAKLHASGQSAWAHHNAYEDMGHYAYHGQIKVEKNEDRRSQDSEPNRSATSSLAPLPVQRKEMTSPLVSDEEVFPLSPPGLSFPASLAAQHFLLEEEKRAKELEKLLNTHIDELQRHTEFTLNKYTKLKQNRHI
ncbi:deuterosome assembly protein 1 isoform X3 [Saccopteryx bilineata]|uniref:deuterosome assembly protein 1 isoform X3 n=1 Tax=Saccopteryx bilineata TaxID=59482 RepID=UPI003390251B